MRKKTLLIAAAITGAACSITALTQHASGAAACNRWASLSPAPVRARRGPGRSRRRGQDIARRLQPRPALAAARGGPISARAHPADRRR